LELFLSVHQRRILPLILTRVHPIFGYHRFVARLCAVSFFEILEREVSDKPDLSSNVCVGNHHRYKANASSTYRANGANFYIRYGDGSYAAGYFDNDTVNVSQDKAKKLHPIYV
jgi:hypothetical protein